MQQETDEELQLEMVGADVWAVVGSGAGCWMVGAAFLTAPHPPPFHLFLAHNSPVHYNLEAADGELQLEMEKKGELPS